MIPGCKHAPKANNKTDYCPDCYTNAPKCFLCGCTADLRQDFRGKLRCNLCLFDNDYALAHGDCNCLNGHVEGCSKWDGAQAYQCLKGDIESLQQLAKDDFKINVGFNGVVYYIGVKHPHQEEEFTADTLQEALRELGDWVSHCDQGR